MLISLPSPHASLYCIFRAVPPEGFTQYHQFQQPNRVNLENINTKPRIVSTRELRLILAWINGPVGDYNLTANTRLQENHSPKPRQSSP